MIHISAVKQRLLFKTIRITAISFNIYKICRVRSSEPNLHALVALLWFTRWNIWNHLNEMVPVRDVWFLLKWPEMGKMTPSDVNGPT